MTGKPEKTRKEKTRPGTRGGLEGFITGISTVQDEMRAMIAFFIDIVLIGLDFLKAEAERLGRQYQTDRPNLPLGHRVRFTNAFLDYRRTRRGTSRKLGHLAAYKRAMDALHDLVDIESDPARLRRFHEMKIELMMNVLRLLIDILRDMIKMSNDLKRAEENLIL